MPRCADIGQVEAVREARFALTDALEPCRELILMVIVLESRMHSYAGRCSVRSVQLPSCSAPSIDVVRSAQL
eukprot:15449580-Alexandrium_andersonii.AAC.1